MPEITVVIPTFNHADTIRCAVGSVFQQTLQDFELIVVGDGAPPQTDTIMAELCATDGRVHYLPHPKGAGNGEAYRAEALAGAAGNVVCYLADDDLWLPEHLETVMALLEHADFVHTLHTLVTPEGRVKALGGSLASNLVRKKMQQGRWNFFGPTCAAHTLEAYRRLPHGWRPRPEGLMSDLHMWRQWLDQPWCRFLSEPVPTTLHFPSPLRKGWSVAQRCDELDRWVPRLSEAGFAHWLTRQVLEDWQLRVTRPEFFADLARRLAVAGDWVTVEALFRTGLDQDSDNGWLHNGLSNALYKQGKIAESIEAAERAVECKPDASQIWTQLGDVLLSQKRWTEAAEKFRTAVKLDGTNASVYRSLSQALLGQGLNDEAISVGLEALRRAPDNVQYRTHVGKLLLMSEHLDEAEAVYREGIEKSVKNPEFYKGLAEVFRRQGRIDKAESIELSGLAAGRQF